MTSKIRIGDIIEIATQKGLAYAQYTHEHREPPRMGSLIRVLPGFYKKTPEKFDEIVERMHTFQIFFPLKVSVNLKLVTIVGNVPVPKQYQKFPIFRGGLPNPKTWKVDTWWFWDGEKEWKVGKITEEQKKLPICSVVNYTRLLEMIELGWLPEADINT